LEKNIKLVFNSNLTDIVECNDSFDSGVLYIAYHGDNRNGSSISKEVFEKCAHTMYDVPVVAHYIRDDDIIGGHDAEIVRKDGRPTLVNMTHPVGVVPESANYWWETVEEEDGTEHEYLCTNVLLWKRQEAYSTIKENGVTSESMEISVKSGKMDGGVYVIEDFQFLAFCLLGNCEPCFESASLATFSSDSFVAEFRSMLEDLPSATRKFKEEVSNKEMNRKLKLMEQYGLTLDDLDFELSEFTVNELKEKFEAIKKSFDNDHDGSEGGNETAEPETVEDHTAEGSGSNESFAGDSDASTTGGGNESETNSEEDDEGAENEEDDEGGQVPKRVGFALASQLRDELRRALQKETYIDDWGDECWHFWMVDYDVDQKLVYCEDAKCGWILVRMNWDYDGDSVVVDFNSAARVKVAYVDYVEGTAQTEQIGEAMQEFAKARVATITNKFSAEKKAIESELETLRAFKSDADKAKRAADEEELFAQFADLNGVAEFDSLRADCATMDLSSIEEKCFAIRGRQVNYSVKPKQKHNTVLPVGDGGCTEDEPYGGVFEKYRKLR